MKELLFIVFVIFIYEKYVKPKSPIPQLDTILDPILDPLKSIISTTAAASILSPIIQVVTSKPQIKGFSPNYCMLGMPMSWIQANINMLSNYRVNAWRFFLWCNWGDNPASQRFFIFSGNISNINQGMLDKLVSVADQMNSKGIWPIVSIFTQYDGYIGSSTADKKSYIDRVVKALKNKKVIYDLVNEDGGRNAEILGLMKPYGVLTCTYAGADLGASYYSIHTGSHSYGGGQGDNRYIHSTDSPDAFSGMDAGSLINIAKTAIAKGGNFEFLGAWRMDNGDGIYDANSIGSHYRAVLEGIKSLP